GARTPAADRGPPTRPGPEAAEAPGEPDGRAGSDGGTPAAKRSVLGAALGETGLGRRTGRRRAPRRDLGRVARVPCGRPQGDSWPRVRTNGVPERPGPDRRAELAVSAAGSADAAHR